MSSFPYRYRLAPRCTSTLPAAGKETAKALLSYTSRPELSLLTSLVFFSELRYGIGACATLSGRCRLGDNFFAKMTVLDKNC